MKKIILLGLVLILVSSVYGIDCDLTSIVSNDGYAYPNFVLEEDDEIFCNNTILTLRNGLDIVVNFTIYGEFRMINSSLETAYDVNSSFIVKEDGLLMINNSEVISADRIGPGGRTGEYNFSFEKDSDVALINVSFDNITNFDVETSSLLFRNVDLSDAPFNLYEVSPVIQRMENISTTGKLSINESNGLFFYDSAFGIKNDSYIHNSAELRMINSTFYVTNESNLSIIDSQEIEFNNLTFIDLNTKSAPIFNDSIISLNENSYLDIIDTNSSFIKILDENSYFDQYYTITYNITNERTEGRVSYYDVNAYNKSDSLFLTTQANKKGISRLPLLSFTRNLTNTTYYSNYTNLFSKKNYENMNHTLNVTKRETYNLTIKTTKGIIPVGDNCTSDKSFCAEKNPYKFENMVKNDYETITFTVNATGNGHYITGKSFPFFLIVESSLSKVETLETDSITITVIE